MGNHLIFHKVNQFLSVDKVGELPIQKEIPKIQRVSSRGTYSALIRKNSTTYACTRVQRNSFTLQGPNSSVKLHVPPDVDAVVMGHAHTDVKPFLHVIPGNECLVSPVAEYHCTPKEGKDVWFRIQIPHCVRKKHLQYVTVRHGDIHSNVAFSEVPMEKTPQTDCYFELDEDKITIYTTHFSQFICTQCENMCYGDGKAFTFGGLSPLAFTPLTAALRLYMCSPLFKIDDYRMVGVNTNIVESCSQNCTPYNSKCTL